MSTQVTVETLSKNDLVDFGGEQHRVSRMAPYSTIEHLSDADNVATLTPVYNADGVRLYKFAAVRGSELFTDYRGRTEVGAIWPEGTQVTLIESAPVADPVG